MLSGDIEVIAITNKIYQARLSHGIRREDLTKLTNLNQQRALLTLVDGLL